MENHVDYVVGFCFSNGGSRLVLIKKRKPEWQRGLLNGVGGKIEPGESPLQAVRREYFEETGTIAGDWTHFLTLSAGNPGVSKSARIFFFVSFCTASVESVTSTTEEEIEVVDVETLNVKTCVANLRWLIPMARYWFDEYRTGRDVVRYEVSEKFEEESDPAIAGETISGALISEKGAR